MLSCKARHQNTYQFDAEMKKSITGYPSIDERTRLQADRFLREAKPKLDDMLKQAYQLNDAQAGQ